MTPLSTTHLGFLALIALYLSAFHGAGQSSVVVMLIIGVVAELLPRWLRRVFVPEALLIVGIAGCWWWLVPHENAEAIHAAAGMAIAYWLLVPSRLGMLRWVLSLVIVELLLQSRLNGVAMSTLLCVPIGLAALGIDSWLCGAITAKASARLKAQTGSSLIRWALVPTAVVIMAAISAGTWVVKEATRHHVADQQKESKDGKRQQKVAGLDNTMNLGDHDSVDRDPRIAARLSWETGADPTGTVYLRAMALSELILKGSTLSWKPERVDKLLPAPPATHQPTRWARVLRMPSNDDVILRPDGGDAVDLDGLLVDHDGNRYRPQLGEALRSYRADFDDGQLEADPATMARYRDIDPRLNTLPWAEIEDARWHSVSPERAAVLVRERLGERCTYDLVHLPTPADGPGGVIRGFLFGRTAAERRGHCQYFATAAVLLLRRAGHTARCVVGFASDEIDDRGVVFRGLHAHAWVEVVNAQGRWQRVDPTPATRATRIIEGINFKPENADNPLEEPKPQDLPPVATTEAGNISAITQRWWPFLVAGALSLLAFVIVLVHRNAGKVRLDPRLAELQRRNDDLVRLAMSLGVTVTPATTISELASALERRTGVVLERHLDAHLAARYGNGPMPEPWPMDALRLGARTKPSAVKV
ncbi:MAG TPA: transglutaminase domain-containing protein [Planctomycetota bacterium]|nr:transglutaminase domain-containing protein [Planctomycetota bacterium]